MSEYGLYVVYDPGGRTAPGAIHELMPVARIVDGLMKDAASVFSRLAGSHH